MISTLYSYGFAVSSKIFKRQNVDIFWTILTGYIVVGTITLILHFFFKINNLVSIFFITSSFAIFYHLRHEIDIKKNLLSTLIILLFSFFFIWILGSSHRHKYVSSSLCIVS